ncbi:MAG TPA: hypothetical protein VHX20_17780 [Terracidiphilus sp.]|jgi:hypothetical protein|nr:hypothetical protein [Terracidiphilus sp.]
MSKGHAIRESWQPRNSEEKDAILRELDQILDSPQFRNSKRYPALLEYIVKNTLDGRSDELKERTLGVEVFDRSPTYDTNADTIVRYTAGEVRKRLLLYYSDYGHQSGLRISLPAGSYVPEFTFETDAHDKEAEPDGGREMHLHEAAADLHAEAETHTAHSIAAGEQAETVRDVKVRTRRIGWLAAAVVVLVAVTAGLLWRQRALDAETAVDQFWTPVLRDQRGVMICTGSVVFAPNSNYSGVHTAGKDLDYSFVSMQIASAIAQVSDVTERSGANAQLAPSASTPLTDLREHPVILLGAYNNQWTLRLLDPLRFHFAQGAGTDEAILDRMQPSSRWRRDHSLPYSSADDYAIVARFRNSTIDNWLVVLAGLGRNGTEAAAQFATSPHYTELLRSRVGGSFTGKNIEVVLKVSVIEGRSGAPSILAVYTW